MSYKSEPMKKVKTLLAMVLIALVTIPAMAQVNITRTAGTGYFLQTAQGDTLQLRGTTPFYSSYHIAYQDAINHSAETNLEIHVRANFVDRVKAEYFYDYDIIYETIYDTLIVTQVDTVFISETIIDSVFVTQIDTVYFQIRDTVLIGLKNVDWTHTITDNETRITIEGESESVVSIRYGCNEIEQSGSWGVHEGAFSADIPTTCQETFVFEVVHRDGSYKSIYSEQIPMDLLTWEPEPAQGGQWVFTPEDFDPDEWTQFWHGSSTLTSDGHSIILQDTASGSNVWINDLIPYSDQMEVYMVASTAGASPHIRALATPYGYAQDIYYSPGSGELQYAYWNNADPTTEWTQGRYAFQFPIPVEGSGETIHKVLRIENEVVYIKAWFGSEEPDSWLYIIPIDEAYIEKLGGVGIGAHSVNIRYIQFLSVGINGKSAPR